MNKEVRKGVDYPGVAIVFLCHDGRGNYLLMKRGAKARDEQGRWDCGGGGLELGTEVVDCLRAEIMEEYCAEVLEYQFLGYRDMHRVHASTKTHWVALDFRVLLDPSKVKIGEPQKFDDIGWFKIDDLPSPLHSGFEIILPKYKSQLI